jgi:long-chain fatty acid transport protein
MKKIVFLLVIGLPSLLQAQGFQVSLQGQKQQAMAGAGTGLVQDGAALFYNPGGVSFLKDNSISLGATAVISHVQYRDHESSVVSETESPANFPFTGYAVFGKKNSKLKYGIAAYTPFGSTVDWQDGWTGRFVLTHLQLFAIYIQPTVSYKITDKLGIGAGFIYSTGKINLQTDLPLTGQDGTVASSELDGKLTGYGFNAGIYYEPTSMVSLGFTYHSAINMDVKNGKANFALPASLAGNFPTGGFKATIPLPSIMSLGIGIKATKKLAIAFDVSMIGWSSFDTIIADFQNKSTPIKNIKLARDYKNGYAFRLGGQYSVNSKLDLRAGIKHLISPVKDGYVTPDVPDQTHFNYSAGLSYKFSKNFSADASFTFQKMKRSDTNLESRLSGTYKTNIFMPGLSFNYNF